MTERVSIRLYAAAFVLMLTAGVVLAIAGLGALSSLGLLWLSAGLSAGFVKPRHEGMLLESKTDPNIAFVAKQMARARLAELAAKHSA